MLIDHFMAPALGRIPVMRVEALHGAMQGFSGWVMVADIRDECGALRRVYIKVFTPDSYGLLGEAIRWMIGTTLGVPMARNAWLCQLPSNVLSALWPNADWQADWGGGWVPAFASLALTCHAGTSIRPSFHDPASRDALRRWPQLLSTIALDEWLANSDGNLSNVIQTSDADGEQFATVDGGQVLNGEHWSVASIADLAPHAAGAAVHNKLAHAAFGRTLPRAALAGILGAARNHQRAWDCCRNAVAALLVEMLDDPPLTAMILDVLEKRATLPWLHQRLFG